MDQNLPIQQEAKKGHNVKHVGGDVYLEVSSFRGKTYAGLRRWFQADDGKAYRTKSGINMPIEDMSRLIETIIKDGTSVMAFMATEARDPWSDD